MKIQPSCKTLSTLCTLLAALPCWFTTASAAPVPCDSFPTTLMPAPTGSFTVAPRLRFGTSPVQLDALSLRLPSNSIPPLAEGATQDQTCVFTLDCMSSTDGGVTFQQVRATASAIIQSTGGLVRSSSELVSLDCTLPDGVMLRESPTRRSTGQTTRTEAPLGGSRISSFFDVFMELSVDNGATWTPANGPVRAVQHALAHEVRSPSSALPSASRPITCRTYLRWTASGFSVVLRNTAIVDPTTPIAPPAPGASAVCDTPATLTGEVSLDSGTTFSPFSAPVQLSLRITADSSPAGSVTRHFDTEMLSLSVSGGGTPAGGGLPAGFNIRESPTKVSLGKTSLRTCPDGSCRISSFFDIFTEVSLDFGQNWLPATDGCATFASQFNPREYTLATDLFPYPGTAVSADDCPVSFGNTGVVLSRIRKVDSCLRVSVPTVLPHIACRGSADLLLSLDDGSTFTRHQVPTLSEVMVSSYQVAGGDESPIELLSFSCTVPGPTPVMLRESPTRQSPGTSSKRILNGEYMIGQSSLVCFEVSLDGGGTWTPADAPLRLSHIPRVDQTGVCKTDFLPPRTGTFEVEPPDAGVSYALTQQYLAKKLQKWKVSNFSASQPPPPKRGQTAVIAFACTAGCEFSSDGGSTWEPFEVPATGTMSVTNPLYQESSEAGENPLYETEMLALSFTLPNGMKVRESPTKASTGKASVRFTIKDDRGYPLDFSFSLFTELSDDGGTTWAPGDDSLHLAMHNAPDAAFVHSDWMPYATRMRASDAEFAARVSTTQSVRALDLDCDSPDFQVLSPRMPMPAPGSTSLTQVMSVPARFEYSTDGGTTHTAVHATATLTLRCDEFSAAGSTSSVSSCRVEVLQCDISSSTLPGTPMLRESPTRASKGRTTCRSAPGGFRVASFFDIFVELSFDGGATWLPACDSLRLATSDTSSPVVFSDNMIPPPGVLATRGGALSLRCPIRESPTPAKRIGGYNFVRLLARRLSAPPAAGQSASVIESCTAEMTFSDDDGASFDVVRAPLFMRYQMENVMTNSVQTSYDTEMLQFECSGGSLPTGYMVRESPTRASTGKTSVRARTDGGFSTSSFFDVFIELSIDNGRTWSPFDLPLHLELGDVPVSGDGSTNQWPLLGVHQLPPGDPDFDLFFLDGSHLDAFGMTFDPAAAVTLPAPGASIINSRTCTCPIGYYVSSTTPRRLVVIVGGSDVKITALPTTPDGIRSFDTEMLSLDLTLPDGVRLRESPTKASVGRMFKAVNHRSIVFDTSSYFDIFLELSTDNGATWSPAERALHLDFATPELAVTGPGGLDLADGVSSLDFGACLVGSPRQLTCVFTNHGQSELNIPSLSITGTHAADFTVSPAPPFTLPPNGGTLAVKVTCTSSSAGDKSAALHVACDDPDENPFDLALSARVLVGSADQDNDGVTNAQELAQAACGFDPFVHSSGLLDMLRDDGFYRSTDMQGLALGRPVLARDAATGNFHLRLGVLRSPDLSPPWTPMLQLTPTFDPASGQLDLEFAPPGGSAHFFKVFGEAP